MKSGFHRIAARPGARRSEEVVSVITTCPSRPTARS